MIVIFDFAFIVDDSPHEYAFVDARRRQQVFAALADS
jgi:hypothetical protein